DALREPRVAPFSPVDARRLQLSADGQELVFVKDGDRWKMVRPLEADADAGKINDLLGKLSALEGRGDQDRYPAAGQAEADFLASFGLEKPAAVAVVTVVEEERKEGVAEKKTRSLSVRLSKPKDGKLYAQAAGWPRVTQVDDTLSADVARKPL